MIRSPFDWNTGEPTIFLKSSKQSESTRRSVQLMVAKRKEEGNALYATPESMFTAYSKAKVSPFKKAKK